MQQNVPEIDTKFPVKPYLFFIQRQGRPGSWANYDSFPDGLYAKDLKRGALALRDFLIKRNNV